VPESSDDLQASCTSAFPNWFHQFDTLLPALHQRAFSSVLPSPAPRLSVSAAQSLYSVHLDVARERMSNVWEPETVRRRQKGMQELDAWLQRMPLSWDRNLQTCSPADILAFMEEHWLKQHHGSTLSDGSSIASPSGVNQCLSNLSTGFVQLGRVGPWTNLMPSGNPIQSADIAQYRKGYKLQAWRQGYLEGSAVPMTESKTFALVDYLDSMASACPSAMWRLTFERDIVMILLLWETCLRGNDCGKITQSDFFHVSGESLSFPLSSPVMVGDCIQLVINGSKTVKGERAAPIFLTASSDVCHSLLVRLHTYVCHRGDPSMWRFLFSPLTRDQSGFQDCRLSSSAMGKRIHLHLEQSGLYGGESNHGFRRGQLQATTAAGATSVEVGLKGQIKTPATIDRYTDNFRHVPRLERQQKRSFGVMSRV